MMKFLFAEKKVRIFLHVVLVLFLVFPMLGNTGSLPSQWFPDNQPFETITLPPEALKMGSLLELDQSVKSKNLKLDTSLAELAAAHNQLSINLTAQKHDLNVADQRVQVHLRINQDRLEDVLQAVAVAGGEVTKSSPDGSVLQGWLPLTALESLSTRADIFQIQQPAQLTYFDLDVGALTTEGLAALNGTAWHTAGFNGQGVKIGVIDGGYDGYLSLLGTDLPGAITAKNFVDGETDAQLDATSVHGTACAEVIHDVAPGAALYLAKISTYLDLVDAVAWLRDVAQVDIISTSFGFYNLSPGDGTGVFEDLIKSARDTGILWVTAASNDRQVHWGGSFIDKNADSVHDYYDNGDINYFGLQGGSAYLVPAGYPIQIFLRWDDWTYVNQDYDLYLYRYNGSSWVQVTYSTRVQNGGPGQTPTEAIQIYAPVQAAYGYIIVRYQSTRSVNLEVSTPKMTGLFYRLNSRSLSNVADSASAMTVAALNVTDPYVLETYSSQGPTNGPGGIATGGLIKPNISGFANVSTVSYGTLNKFNGTSSATPHVAGAAALVLQANPAFGPDQLQTFLQSRAVDMGVAGLDTLYGYGRLYLGAPPSLKTFLPLIQKGT